MMICGDNNKGARFGCGGRITCIDEMYRCTTCSVPFHRQCAQVHFLGVEMWKIDAGNLNEEERQILEKENKN